MRRIVRFGPPIASRQSLLFAESCVSFPARIVIGRWWPDDLAIWIDGIAVCGQSRLMIALALHSVSHRDFWARTPVRFRANPTMTVEPLLPIDGAKAFVQEKRRALCCKLIEDATELHVELTVEQFRVAIDRRFFQVAAYPTPQ